VAKKKKKKNQQQPNVIETPLTANPYSVATARVSQDIGFNPYLDIKKYWGHLGVVPSIVPYQLFDLVDWLTLTDPYVNKYHQSTIALANAGHILTIDAPSASEAQKAINEANRLAERCFPLSGGVFGLSSACFSQLARTGATCVEWVPNPSLDYVDEAFVVPVKTIRFTYREDGMGYTLCQQQIGIGALEHIGIVPLNMAQTFYYNAVVRDGSPYPIPPIISAIESCGIHKDIIDKIRMWMAKLSSLGVMIAEVEPPPRYPGQTQENYDAFAQGYLDKIAQSVSTNMASGLAVAYNNTKFQFSNTQAGASGAHDLLQMVLQGVFAGLQRDPIMFGWNSGKSDAFVKVIYEELQQGLKFYQSGVSKVIEMGHRLNFALLGLGGCNAHISFKPSRSLDSFRDSEASYMDSKKILEQLTSLPPAISVDEARRKLGYDEVPILNENTFVAEFSNTNNEYRALSKESHIYSFPVQPNDNGSDSYSGRLENILSKANNEGYLAFSAWLAMQMKLSREQVVREGINTYISHLEDSIKTEEVSQIALQEVRDSWREGQEDPRLFAKSDIKKTDTNKGSDEAAALVYLASIFEPYSTKNFMSRSKWRLERTRSAIDDLYSQYGLDNPTPDKINAFKLAASFFIGNMSQEAAAAIGNIASSRAKRWGATFALKDSGVKRFVVVGPEDDRKCAFCYAMLGKVFSVDSEVENINNTVQSKSPDYDMLEFITKKYTVAQVKEMSGEDIQAAGLGGPPYHNNCRDWLEAI
jgi:hypothetical protein